VYFHFTNKRTLLKESVDVAAVGDDAPIPLLGRPFVRGWCATRPPWTRRWLLAEKGALRAGLTPDRASDIVFALISHEVFLLLTVERGWGVDEWERWITATVGDAVLG
jgi:hypothetical protein